MPVAEAANVHIEQYDPAADRRALEQLAQACEAFSPTVGLEDNARPESLLLDISGLAPLFGDEAALAEQIAHAFAHRGLTVRVAIADTLAAAWAVAHHADSHHADSLSIVPPGQTRPAVANLPVAALRIPAEIVAVLAELGVHRIGQLLNLPPASLAARFDPLLVGRLDQLRGAVPETIAAHRPPPEIVVKRQLEFALDRREAVEHVLDALIEQVSAALAARSKEPCGWSAICRSNAASHCNSWSACFRPATNRGICAS